MKKTLLSVVVVFACWALKAQSANVWINEIHYDNQAPDTSEGFEIAGTAGTNLACYEVLLYNGQNGQLYLSDTLSGVIPTLACNTGAVWFGLPQNSMQDAGPAGLALIYAPQTTGCGALGNDTLIQFLSYEGTFTAVNGFAAGHNSDYIGVFEDGNTLVGNSLQLGGTGYRYNQFAWQTPLTATPGAANINQSFCLAQRFSIITSDQTFFEDVGQVIVTVGLNNPSPNPTSVTLQVVPIGTSANQGTDYIFSDTTLTWAPNTSGGIQVPITVIDDIVTELNETVELKLSNPTNGATLLDSLFVLTILDNDTISTGNCADLFFSEYIEGSSNNKALEIYNPTSVPVDLSNYRVLKSMDGGASTAVFGLSGMLASKDVYVMANTLAAGSILAVADTVSPFFDFDGNDALALLNLNDTLDIIGEIGINPGVAWTLDSGATQNHTLIRSFYVYKGDTIWNTAADEWNVFANDMFDSLGFHHTAPCGTVQPPPPAVINFVSVADTVIEGVKTLKVRVVVVNPSGLNAHYVVIRDDLASTATFSQDYNFPTVQRNDGAGITNDSMDLFVLDDALLEPAETVVLRFINLSSNVVIGPDSIYRLTIIDTDRIEVSFLGAEFSYVEKDTTVAIKVTVSTPITDSVSVHISLASGNATRNSDFRFNDTTLIFHNDGIDTLGVWVTLLDDQIDEGNEQINFDLTNATGAVITISAYTLTIIDNDSTVGIGNLDFENRLKVFPNPVANTLFMQSEMEISHVYVTDLMGQVVINVGNVPVGKSEMDVSNLAPGMYFLTGKCGDSRGSCRFIKIQN